jgi:hypothetical protein
MLVLAENCYQRIKGTNLFKTPNYTRVTVLNRFQTGYVGEFALAAFFVEHKVRHVHRIIPDGRSHGPEFTVWEEGKPRLLEVKTSGQPFHKHMAWPPEQEVEAAKWMVGMRLDLPNMEAEIMGYARVGIDPFYEGYLPTAIEKSNLMDYAPGGCCPVRAFGELGPLLDRAGEPRAAAVVEAAPVITPTIGYVYDVSLPF